MFLVYLVAIYGIIILDRIYFSDRKGYCKSNNRYGKSLTHTALENPHIKLNRRLKSVREPKRENCPLTGCLRKQYGKQSIQWAWWQSISCAILTVHFSVEVGPKHNLGSKHQWISGMFGSGLGLFRLSPFPTNLQSAQFGIQLPGSLYWKSNPVRCQAPVMRIIICKIHTRPFLSQGLNWCWGFAQVLCTGVGFAL